MGLSAGGRNHSGRQSLEHDLTAIDIDRLAGDVARCRTRKKRSDGADVLHRVAESTERGRALAGLDLFRMHGEESFRSLRESSPKQRLPSTRLAPVRLCQLILSILSYTRAS